MKNDKTDFTQGSILKKLALFMLPILGALVLQAAYGAVDLLVVGRFGSTSGLSAVSTGSQVLNLVTFVVTQLAMGVTVLIAHYLGEKNQEQIGSVIGGAAVVFALLAARDARALGEDQNVLAALQRMLGGAQALHIGSTTLHGDAANAAKGPAHNLALGELGLKDGTNAAPPKEQRRLHGQELGHRGVVADDHAAASCQRQHGHQDRKSVV